MRRLIVLVLCLLYSNVRCLPANPVEMRISIQQTGNPNVKTFSTYPEPSRKESPNSLEKGTKIEEAKVTKDESNSEKNIKGETIVKSESDATANEAAAETTVGTPEATAAAEESKAAAEATDSGSSDQNGSELVDIQSATLNATAVTEDRSSQMEEQHSKPIEKVDSLGQDALSMGTSEDTGMRDEIFEKPNEEEPITEKHFVSEAAESSPTLIPTSAVEVPVDVDGGSAAAIPSVPAPVEANLNHGFGVELPPPAIGERDLIPGDDEYYEYEVIDPLEEPLIIPGGGIFLGEPNGVYVEATPDTENNQNFPVVVEEEEEAALPEDDEHGNSSTSEMPAPMAEIEPSVNVPIAALDEAFVISREGVRPEVELSRDDSMIDIATPEETGTDAALGVAPQIPERITPIIEAEMPFTDDDTTAVTQDEMAKEEVERTASQKEPSANSTPIEGETLTKTEEMQENKEQIAAEDESKGALMTEKEENEKMAGFMTDAEFESRMEVNSTTTTEPAAEIQDDVYSDGTATEEMKEQVLGETTSVDDGIPVPDMTMEADLKETLESDLPELMMPSTTTADPAIDPVELALQQENDDTSLNEAV